MTFDPTAILAAIRTLTERVKQLEHMRDSHGAAINAHSVNESATNDALMDHAGRLSAHDDEIKLHVAALDERAGDIGELRHVLDAYGRRLTKLEQSAAVAAARPATPVDKLEAIMAGLRKQLADAEALAESRWRWANQVAEVAEKQTAEAIAKWLEQYQPSAWTMRDHGVQNERVEAVAKMLASDIRSWKEIK